MTAAVPMDSARRKRVNLVASPPPRNIATDLAESVKTPTMLSIMTALAVAREMADIIVVYGAPGVGKTTSALAYLSAQFSQCNAVEQRTQPVDAPVGYVAAHPAVAGVVPLLKYVCDALGVGGIDRASGAAELHTAIVRRLTGQRCLLIVDEAQHLSGAALEQLRAIHDAAGVALALMGNRDLIARLSGAMLEGFRSRIGRQLNIEANTLQDAAALAEAWGISCAKGRKLLAEICASGGGLRAAVKTLRLAEMTVRGGNRAWTVDNMSAAWKELGGG